MLQQLQKSDRPYQRNQKPIKMVQRLRKYNYKEALNWRPEPKRQTVSIDTVIPTLPKPEEMLAPPDHKKMEKEFGILNKKIRYLKTKLEEIEDPKEEVENPTELQNKIISLRNERNILMKQINVFDERDKKLWREISTDQNYAKILKEKRKLTFYQAINRKDKIENKISVGTLNPEEEKKLIKELDQIVSIFPSLTKANEREKIQKDRKRMWEQYQEYTTKIEGIESKLRSFYKAADSKTNEEVKSVSNLPKTKLSVDIENLYEQKRKLEEQFCKEREAYISQQSLCLTANWISKRKQQLIKNRLRHTKMQQKNHIKCAELIEICERILSKYHKELNKQKIGRKIKDRIICKPKKEFRRVFSILAKNRNLQNEVKINTQFIKGQNRPFTQQQRSQTRKSTQYFQQTWKESKAQQKKGEKKGSFDHGAGA